MMEFLKCDAPGCDHRENVDKITAQMIGKECPKCGANLLSKHDWEVYVKLSASLNALEAMGVKVLADADTPPEMVATFNYHEGNLNIRLPEHLNTRKGQE